MLIRSHDDASSNEDRWRPFVESQGFGQLIACGRERSVAVVVPTQFVLVDDTIILHLARANPIFDCLEENDQCVMSVAGDWAYIPGSWKAIGEEDPQRGIPTTYYGAVQLTGAAELIDDAPDTAGVLRTQLSSVEPDHDYVDPIEHGSMLRAIRGISIAVSEVRAKFKFGGNVDPAHRSHVAAQLGERAAPGDASAITQLATDSSSPTHPE